MDAKAAVALAHKPHLDKTKYKRKENRIKYQKWLEMGC